MHCLQNQKTKIVFIFLVGKISTVLNSAGHEEQVLKE